jgi:hypothetical protein
MGTRTQNEKKFGQWEELPGGGRRYRLDVPGKLGWLARYFKEGGRGRNDGAFLAGDLQRRGKLVETHEKFPVDKGHQKV